MAKITIVIEDLPGNKVKVEMNPNFETLMKMDMSGHNLTSAHGYALKAVNAIRVASKVNGPLGISIPRIKKN